MMFDYTAFKESGDTHLVQPKLLHPSFFICVSGPIFIVLRDPLPRVWYDVLSEERNLALAPTSEGGGKGYIWGLFHARVA